MANIPKRQKKERSIPVVDEKLEPIFMRLRQLENVLYSVLVHVTGDTNDRIEIKKFLIQNREELEEQWYADETSVDEEHDLSLDGTDSATSKQ